MSRPWVSMVLASVVLAAGAWGQPMRDLTEAALDQKITQKIEISERPIRDALHELETRTGLRFELDEAAVEWMPYGEQTRLAVVLEDISVRQALTRIFEGLGLSLKVVADKVVVAPAPVLDRLGRRLTIDELNLLQKLAGGPWATAKPADLVIEFRMSAEGDPRPMLDRALADAPGSTALAQLEVATQRQGWLWVPNGRNIAVYPRTEDVQMRLDRPLDVSYRRLPLDELLLDLGKRVGITVHFEPGVLQRVAARDRNVDLIQRGTTLRQIMELVIGNTGLWYEVVEDGIVVTLPPKSDSGEPATGEQPRARVVAIVRVPVGTDGTTIDFLIRDDELPPEFKQLRDRKLPEIIELLRQKLGN